MYGGTKTFLIFAPFPILVFVIEVKINTTASSQEWTFPLEDKRLRHRQDAVGASGKMTSNSSLPSNNWEESSHGGTHLDPSTLEDRSRRIRN